MGHRILCNFNNSLLLYTYNLYIALYIAYYVYYWKTRGNPDVIVYQYKNN